MAWQHIYPLRDIYEHDLDGFDCDCNPYLDWNYNLVIHYAFDGRDLIEEPGAEMIDLPDGSSVRVDPDRRIRLDDGRA